MLKVAIEFIKEMSRICFHMFLALAINWITLYSYTLKDTYPNSSIYVPVQNKYPKIPMPFLQYVFY